MNGISINIGFDDKGETITDIGLYKDIVEVTGQERIWSTNPKEKKSEKLDAPFREATNTYNVA